MGKRICGCPLQGPRLREGVGAKLGLCSCCKMLGGVVELPVTDPSVKIGKIGGGYETGYTNRAFCGPCINPKHKEPSSKKIHRTGESERGIHVGVRYYRVDAIPETFWQAMDRDDTQLPHQHPSAQIQKAMDRRRHA